MRLGAAALWVRMCVMRLLEAAKRFLQPACLQAKGRSQVWLRMCVVRFLDRAKRFLQPACLQTKGRSPAWLRMCLVWRTPTLAPVLSVAKIPKQLIPPPVGHVRRCFPFTSYTILYYTPHSSGRGRGCCHIGLIPEEAMGTGVFPKIARVLWSR